jgi:hypothetical protein
VWIRRRVLRERHCEQSPGGGSRGASCEVWHVHEARERDARRPACLPAGRLDRDVSVPLAKHEPMALRQQLHVRFFRCQKQRQRRRGLPGPGDRLASVHRQRVGWHLPDHGCSVCADLIACDSYRRCGPCALPGTHLSWLRCLCGALYTTSWLGNIWVRCSTSTYSRLTALAKRRRIIGAPWATKGSIRDGFVGVPQEVASPHAGVLRSTRRVVCAPNPWWKEARSSGFREHCSYCWVGIEHSHPTLCSADTGSDQRRRHQPAHISRRCELHCVLSPACGLDAYLYSGIGQYPKGRYSPVPRGRQWPPCVSGTKRRRGAR